MLSRSINNWKKYSLLILFITITIANVFAGDSLKNTKPNILVIFTDDKGQYPPSKEELEKVYKHSIGKCVNPEYDAFK